jgi:hypothetical protein
LQRGQNLDLGNGEPGVAQLFVVPAHDESVQPRDPDAEAGLVHLLGEGGRRIDGPPAGGILLHLHLRLLSVSAS